ncbi:TPA: polysaccharide pyruvyl transferase family protein [Photobacterium damselae]
MSSLIKEKLIKRSGTNRYLETRTNDNLIGLYDTSIGSLNVGDEIINSATYTVLDGLFPKKQFIRASTHDGTSSIGIYHLNQAKERFLCGSNILNGRMFSSAQWNVGLLDIIRMKRLITLGVGWVDYQKKSSLYSKLALNHLLSKDIMHSVRDEYTKKKLAEINIHNVINTSCCTMWSLTPEHCNDIQSMKSKNVVFTLTDYRQDKVSDELLIKILLRNYDTVYLWLQGDGDLSYFKMLNIDHSQINLIPPKLSSYDSILSKGDIDFIGTRLHAGIRALQHKIRTIIIGVDNRAIEKQADFNINVIQRNDIKSDLEKSLQSDIKMDIKIPITQISEWKNQFE